MSGNERDSQIPSTSWGDAPERPAPITWEDAASPSHAAGESGVSAQSGQGGWSMRDGSEERAQKASEAMSDMNRVGLGLPFALSTLGALIGVAIWVVIGILTNTEIGYVAIVLGFLAGRGARLGTGGLGGVSIQLMSAVVAVFGIVLAKYMLVSHFEGTMGANYAMAVGPTYLISPVVFAELLPSVFHPMDLLWLVLAAAGGWGGAKR